MSVYIGHFSFTNLLTSRQKTAFHYKQTAGRAATTPWPCLLTNRRPQPMTICSTSTGPDAQSLLRPSDPSVMSLRAHDLHVRARSLLHGQQALRRTVRQAIFSQGVGFPTTLIAVSHVRPRRLAIESPVHRQVSRVYQLSRAPVMICK